MSDTFGEGLDEFIFKENREISPQRLRAFLPDLERYLEERDITVSSDDVEITAEIDLSSEEEIARVLFDLYRKMKIQEEGGGQVKDFVDGHLNFQRMLLRARQMCAKD